MRAAVSLAELAKADAIGVKKISLEVLISRVFAAATSVVLLSD